MFSRKYKTFGEQELKQVKEKFTLIVADITRIKVEIPEKFLVRLGPKTTKVEIEDLGRCWIRLLHEVEDRCGSLIRRTSELQKLKKIVGSKGFKSKFPLKLPINYIVHTKRNPLFLSRDDSMLYEVLPYLLETSIF